MLFYRRKIFFKIARIVAMFVIGLGVALFIALSQVDLETLRGDLVNVLRDSTGLPVEIDGAVSWKFGIRPKVELNKIRIPNSEWAHEKNGFTADKIDVTINLVSLLRDRPTIQNIKIHDAVINLEKNESGEYSIASTNAPAGHDTEHDDDYPFNDFGLGSVEIDNLVAHVDGGVYSLTGFQVNYTEGDDAREYSGWIKSDDSIYPFIINVSKLNLARKVYPVRIAISTGGDALVANLALEATSKTPIDFIVRGTIGDIEPLGKIFDVKIPQLPSIKVNLIGGFGHKKLTLRKSSVSFSDVDLTVSGAIDWSEKVPVINARVKSKKIDLPDLFPDLYKPGKKWVHPNRDLNIFKNVSLHGAELFDRNVELNVEVENLIVYRDLNIKNINFHAKLADSKFRADASAKFADGDVRAAAEINTDPKGRLTIRAAGFGERVYIGEIMQGLRESDFISELPINAEFYLEGSGSNLSELMGTTTGPIYVYSVAPGYIHSKLVSYVYGTDFLTDLRHNIQDLFSGAKKNNQITVSCAAIKLKLRNGMIETTNGIAIETNAINVRLAGTADLKNEKINASLVTVPSRGLKISLTGGLTNSMTFTGNMAEPDVKLNGAAVVGRVASATGIGLLLAPLTGGISIVAGAGLGLVAGDFVENWLADDHPCRTALENGAPAKQGDPEWLNMSMPTLVGRMITK